MAISVVNPVSPAIERTKQVLFQPFDLGKWFVVGFSAWLAQLGQGGPHFGFNFSPRPAPAPAPGPGPAPGPRPDAGAQPVLNWIQANLPLVIALAGIALPTVLAIWLVLTWLSSRAHFMFLDNIVRNRGAVAEPWQEYRPQGNSLFGFRVGFSLAVLLVLALVAGASLLIAWPDMQAGVFGASAILALVLGITLAGLVLLVAALVSLFLYDFVIPIMFLRRLPITSAWGLCWTELVAGRVGTFVLYLLFKIVLSMAVGMLALMVFCCTCCLAVLPYVGTVILLPFLVFQRSYPLCFLAQFGPAWQFFPTRGFRDQYEENEQEGGAYEDRYEGE